MRPMTVLELIKALREMNPQAIVMVYDVEKLRVRPIIAVGADEYISADKLDSRLRITDEVNLKPGQEIARLSY